MSKEEAENFISSEENLCEIQLKKYDSEGILFSFSGDFDFTIKEIEKSIFVI
jgi:hypothetical protein